MLIENYLRFAFILMSCGDISLASRATQKCNVCVQVCQDPFRFEFFQFCRLPLTERPFSAILVLK